VSVSDPIPPAPPRRSSAKTVVIAVVIVIISFLSGAAAGIFVDHIYMRRHFGVGRGPHIAPSLIMRRLDRSLDLTPAQHDRIKEIVERHHRRILEISENIRPQIHRELEATNAEITAVLTPEQREKYEKLKMHLGHPRGRSRRESTR
jgi:Spy/CpxP family protein refolding chaperone